MWCSSINLWGSTLLLRSRIQDLCLARHSNHCVNSPRTDMLATHCFPCSVTSGCSSICLLGSPQAACAWHGFPTPFSGCATVPVRAADLPHLYPRSLQATTTYVNEDTRVLSPWALDPAPFPSVLRLNALSHRGGSVHIFSDSVFSLFFPCLRLAFLSIHSSIGNTTLWGK